MGHDLVTNAAWNREEAIVAVTDSNGEWQYLTFPTWAEAREAVNDARSKGKAAVFYDGATLPKPPETLIHKENPES